MGKKGRSSRSRQEQSGTPNEPPLELTPSVPPAEPAIEAETSGTPPPVGTSSAPQTRRPRSRRPRRSQAPPPVQPVEAHLEAAPVEAGVEPSAEAAGLDAPLAEEAVPAPEAAAAAGQVAESPVETAAPAAEAATTPPAPPASEQDDVSVPPAADLPMMDLYDGFFSIGSARTSDAPVEEETRDPRAAQKMTPQARKRRAEFTKYVKAAVGISAALCLAALVKVAVARNHSAEAEPRRSQTAAQLAAPPVAQPPPAAQDPAVKAAPALAEPPPPPEATAAPEDTTAPPTDNAAPADATGQTAPPVDTNGASSGEPVTPDPKEARKAKVASRNALENGHVDESIAAGERSVALDPADGEAWLILGAAYQAKNNLADARRCWKACLSEGKRGPRGECAAMLR
jgi:hypothetical protein